MVLQRYVKQRKEKIRRRKAQQELAMSFMSALDDSNYYRADMDDSSQAGRPPPSGLHMTYAEKVEAFGDIEPPSLEDLRAQQQQQQVQKEEEEEAAAAGGSQSRTAEDRGAGEGVAEQLSPQARRPAKLPPLGVDVKNPLLRGSGIASPDRKSG